MLKLVEDGDDILKNSIGYQKRPIWSDSDMNKGSSLIILTA